MIFEFDELFEWEIWKWVNYVEEGCYNGGDCEFCDCEYG